MNRYENTEHAPELVSQLQSLIERSSLGATAPRLLRERASTEQLDRIRRLRRQRNDVAPGPSEASARRLLAEAMGHLPQRTPDPDGVTIASTYPSGVYKIRYPDDDEGSGTYRNDSDTMTRVVRGLRGSASCTT
ncbi:hypothetical protein IU450_34145 [Nocardia abscessus]|uniref:hypothetical protein n=1 Tax=Nocardia abscessus TaxID=120957 RepID=UPI001895659F|nr:hypothetical protein [Nocardia abscessus]MBF6340895.1 hypothetical protein [Nocardia abscessus]